jgi:hypothetical protein
MMKTKTIAKQKLYGCPDYVSMGAVGGPNIQPEAQNIRRRMTQQQNYIEDLNELLSDGRVNKAVNQALSLMTTEKSYASSFGCVDNQQPYIIKRKHQDVSEIW